MDAKITHEAATKKAAEGAPTHGEFDNSHSVMLTENVGVSQSLEYPDSMSVRDRKEILICPSGTMRFRFI